MPFPTDTPHVIANKLTAQGADDKGACYLERITEDRIIVTVRSPGEARESKVLIPFDVWLKMIADHRPTLEPEWKRSDWIDAEEIDGR